MLVLTRKLNERIIIGNEDGEQIVLTVVELSGGRLRLGIDAPPEVPIMREEVLKRDKAA